MAVRVWTRSTRKEVKASRIERENGNPRVIGDRRAYINGHGDLVIDHDNKGSGRVVIAREQARSFVDALHVICHSCPDMAESEIPTIVG